MLSEETSTRKSCLGVSFFDVKKGADVAEFPNLFSRYLKSYGDIYFWEKGNFHVITKAAHAKEILTSSEFTANRAPFFISRMPELNLALIQDFFGVVGKMMVMSDDRDHALKRRVAATGFEENILARFKDKLSQSVNDLVNSIDPNQGIDFASAIAKKLPATVLADLFSIEEHRREEFLHWSNIMTGFFGGASEYRDEDGIEVNEAAKKLKTFFETLISERKQNPGDDYVSLSIAAAGELGLAEEDLISQLIMMLVAGMATTTDQINNIIFLLASHPEIQSQVRSNPKLLAPALEECKRFDPAVTFIFRLARVDTVIGTQPIKAGDVIFISTHLINRDLPENERPYKLDIHRRAPHFAYGHGPHYCIGAKLGRMEMIELFSQIFAKLPPFEIDPEKPSIRDHYSLSFSGFKELHLRFV